MGLEQNERRDSRCLGPIPCTLLTKRSHFRLCRGRSLPIFLCLGERSHLEILSGTPLSQLRFRDNAR